MQYTEEELQKILDEHKLWLSGEGGQRADLRYADLFDTDLSNDNLSSADLSYADLFGATLRYADLSGTDLSGANLTNSYLFGSNLSGSNLSGANLSNANLSHANLSGANFDRADLSGASLYGSDLSGSDLSGATFDNTLILDNPVNKAPVQLYVLPYNVLITDTMMKIGCQVHSIDAWLDFTVKEIEYMDSDAKDFYDKYGTTIKAAVLSHRVPKEENKES